MGSCPQGGYRRSGLLRSAALAVKFATAGRHITGIDLQQSRVDRLMQGLVNEMALMCDGVDIMSGK